MGNTLDVLVKHSTSLGHQEKKVSGKINFKVLSSAEIPGSQKLFTALATSLSTTN